MISGHRRSCFHTALILARSNVIEQSPDYERVRDIDEECVSQQNDRECVFAEAWRYGDSIARQRIIPDNHRVSLLPLSLMRVLHS